MNSKTISEGILRAVGISVAIVIVAFLVYKIQSVIVYVSAAAVVSLIGRPVVLFFKEKLKFNSTVAVVTTMALLIALLLGLISLFIPLVEAQGHNLSLLDIDQLEADVKVLYLEVVNYVGLDGVDAEQSLKDSGLLSKIDYALIPNFLNSLVSGIGSFSIGLFSVLFISFFFLKDSRLFTNGIMAFVPDSKESEWKNSFHKIKNLLSRYFVGLIFQILILFVIYTIVLLVLGIQNAIVIAFLCALLNLVPYVGPLIGAVLMLVLSMTSNLGEDFSTVILPKTGYVMLGFLIGQLIDNFFSQPIIFSKSVKSHPLEIFLVILIAGVLFGVVGLIIAIPAYTAIKVILKTFLSENKIVKSLTKDL